MTPFEATEIALFSTDDRKGNGARFNIATEDSMIEMTKDGNAFVLKLANYDSVDKSFDYYNHLFYSRAFHTIAGGRYMLMVLKALLIQCLTELLLR